jgi:hypothetical protein
MPSTQFADQLARLAHDFALAVVAAIRASSLEEILATSGETSLAGAASTRRPGGRPQKHVAMPAGGKGSGSRPTESAAARPAQKRGRGRPKGSVKGSVQPRLKRIVDYVTANPGASGAQVREALALDGTIWSLDVRRLVDAGVLGKEGSTRNARYFPAAK